MFCCQKGFPETPETPLYTPLHVMVVESPLNLTVKKTGMADMVSVIDNKVIMVKLLTATRLPGRHARVVKAHVKESLEAQDLAFEQYKFHSEDKLVMTEALIKQNKKGCVKLWAENHENYPVFLEEGTPLGQVQPVQVISNEDIPEILHLKAEDHDSGKEANQNTQMIDTERTSQLLDQLNVAWNAISAEESKKLMILIEEYKDVFAVNPMEVGCTKLVQHHINTGKHTPFKQSP